MIRPLFGIWNRLGITRKNGADLPFEFAEGHCVRPGLKDANGDSVSILGSYAVRSTVSRCQNGERKTVYWPSPSAARRFPPSLLTPEMRQRLYQTAAVEDVWLFAG